MLAACRTESEGLAIPQLDLLPSDVDGFLEAWRGIHAAFADCFMGVFCPNPYGRGKVRARRDLPGGRAKRPSAPSISCRGGRRGARRPT